MGLRVFVVTFWLVGCVGCAFFSPAAPHKAVQFEEAPSPYVSGSFPNWPVPPALNYAELPFALLMTGSRPE